MPALPRLFASRIATTIAEDDPSRPLWRHPASIAAAVLALTLAAVPLLPDDDHDEDDRDEIAPTSETTQAPGSASGRGRLTPQMRAEIDRVLAEGSSLDRARGRTAIARASVRCATFDGQRYCLGFGWTNQIAGGPRGPDDESPGPAAASAPATSTPTAYWRVSPDAARRRGRTPSAQS